MDEQYQEIDLKELFYIVRLRWWIVAVIFIISVTASAVISFCFLDPVYKAETSLFLGKESNSIGSINLGDLQVNNQLVGDYQQMIKTRTIAENVIKELNLDMKVSTFQDRISVSTVKDSRLFKIGFESTDPVLAQKVVDTLAKEIIIMAEDIIEVKNIQVIDVAKVPETPIKPNKKMNVAIAGILGIMLGLGVVFLIEYLDHTIKTEKDVERYLGLNIIGEIPKFQGEERQIRKAGKVGHDKRNKKAS